MRPRETEPTQATYEVTVTDHASGAVVEHLPNASYAETRAIHERFAEDSGKLIVIEQL